MIYLLWLLADKPTMLGEYSTKEGCNQQIVEIAKTSSIPKHKFQCIPTLKRAD